MVASCLEGKRTGRTQGNRLVRGLTPFPTLACLRCVLEHLRLSLHHPSMDLVFDLHKGRFGVGSSPLFDICENCCAFS